MTTYNNIIPEELQNELMEIQNTTKVSSFKLGDITLQVIALNPDEAIEQVYNAVGLFVGKRSRTVREYAAVARFYPETRRREYDQLAFDHFRVAMRLGDKWQEALEWCMEQTDKLNRPATVDSMEIQFAGEETIQNYDQEPDEKDYKAELEKLLERLKKIVHFFRLDDQIIKPLIELIQRVEMINQKQKS